MNVELLAGIAAVMAMATFVMIMLVFVRLKTLGGASDLTGKLATISETGARLERLLHDESSRGREEANASAKALREELSNQIRGFQDSILKNMAEMQQLQKSQLEVFAKQLNEGVAVIDRRVEGMVTALNTSMDEIGKAAETQQEALRQLVDSRLIALKRDSADNDRALREEVQGNLKVLGEGISVSITRIGDMQKEKLELMAKEMAGLSTKQQEAFESLRQTVERRLDTLRGENSEKLEKIRLTVDEQLQGTLEKRLGESFKLVSERLEQVHKGLGEMQSLANGVGDLKRVLTNVKTRGTWGEVQLGNLLEQVLAPDQYAQDTPTKPGSQERVEFAIRLPGRGDGEPEVLLPIDAKFPQEDYDRLVLASERADAEGVEAAGKQLELRVRNSAKDIRDKYINPPHTTDFAMLFLPTEGLYAEVLRRPGLVEQVQRECRVTMVGPTTLMATLNALQMGFRTLAIQKRSSEVWQVLEAVKTEFGKYGNVLDKVQKKLLEASDTINDVAVRRRAIDRKLRSVGDMSEEKAVEILGLTASVLDDLKDEDADAEATE